MVQTSIGMFNCKDYTNQKDRILKLLTNNGFVPTVVLLQKAPQYNARIKELREQGYNIQSVRKNGIGGFELWG